MVQAILTARSAPFGLFRSHWTRTGWMEVATFSTRRRRNANLVGFKFHCPPASIAPIPNNHPSYHCPDHSQTIISVLILPFRKIQRPIGRCHARIP
ncbi:hypothetical protein SCLCIDRAFT_572942 [Scleroderma citrinum Foug A]|uniref:Uncharacterized protein n=1 Tax=Scleroderma citrinum Foug A TaxID=1036808 RepID=A0A0C2YR71_9AGAM|nr:hypothetical protein SCLCIDRAFT_572942 [Scleroderma citrinum Foug A]